MLTAVVYETEGRAAKDAAAVERAKDRSRRATALQVDGWDGVTPRADRVIFMPDVQEWKRTAIESVLATVNETAAPARLPETTEESFRHAMTSQAPRRGRPPKQPNQTNGLG